MQLGCPMLTYQHSTLFCVFVTTIIKMIFFSYYYSLYAQRNKVRSLYIIGFMNCMCKERRLICKGNLARTNVHVYLWDKNQKSDHRSSFPCVVGAWWLVKLTDVAKWGSKIQHHNANHHDHYWCDYRSKPWEDLLQRSLIQWV